MNIATSRKTLELALNNRDHVEEEPGPHQRDLNLVSSNLGEVVLRVATPPLPAFRARTSSTS